MKFHLKKTLVHYPCKSFSSLVDEFLTPCDMYLSTGWDDSIVISDIDINGSDLIVLLLLWWWCILYSDIR